MADLTLPPTPAPEGPAPAAPATPTTLDPQVANLRKSLTPLPMTNDEVTEWQTRIEASKNRITQRETEWDTLAAEYNPKVSSGAEAADVKANTHFRNTHTKIGQLFVRSPKVLLSPKGPALSEKVMPGPDGQPHTYSPTDAIATRQALLNYQMGPEEIDGLRLMDECLLDLQAYAGFVVVWTGYRSVSRSVQKPMMQPDPAFTPSPMDIAPTPPPMVPRMGPDGITPLTQTVPVIIHEEWFAEKLHAKKVLFDEQLRSPRHDRFSRWMGFRGCMNKTKAMRDFGITADEAGAGAEADDRVYEYAQDKTSSAAAKDLLWYSRLWYKPVFFTPTEDHPEKLHELILFDCVRDRPVVHRPSLDQTFDDRGQLTEDSVRGFPLEVGSLRDAIDSPYPQSDAAFTNALVKQLNTFLQQSVLLRDAAIGKYFYDTEAIDLTDLDKMSNGAVGEYVGLKPGLLSQGADKIFYTTAQVKAAPDDWRAIAMLKSYMDETLGISATQAGGTTDTVRSATEINAVGANSQGRQEKERSRVIQLYLRICRKVDQYLYRYATQPKWVAVVGADGSRKMQMWNKTLAAGLCSYDIEPDSQLQIDAARDRQQKVSAYNVLGPDPLFRRIVAIRDIARLCGWDPSEAVVDEATVNAQQMLAQKGMLTGQPPHPGTGPTNKHQLEQSGGTQNAPQPGAGGDNRTERNTPPPGQITRPTP